MKVPSGRVNKLLSRAAQSISPTSEELPMPPRVHQVAIVVYRRAGLSRTPSPTGDEYPRFPHVFTFTTRVCIAQAALDSVRQLQTGAKFKQRRSRPLDFDASKIVYSNVLITRDARHDYP
jgi:hypothetical protein